MKTPDFSVLKDDMKRNELFLYFFALLIVFVLPIHVKYISPVLILWCILWIYEYYSKNLAVDFTKSFKTLFILFIIYYGWQVIGLVYTTDTKMGLSNLFGRLSLVLFPMVLFLPGEMIKNKSRTIVRTFALGTFVFILACFIHALFRSINFQNGLLTFNPNPTKYDWPNYFFSSEFTLFQHPSYIAMYVLMSCFISFEAYFDFSIKFKYRMLWLVIGFSLLITQYFLSSRAGILISLLLVPLYFVIKFREQKKNKHIWILILMIILAFVLLVIKNQRVDYLYRRIFDNQTGYERKQDPRIIIWKSGMQIVKKNLLLGVGIGDVRTELSSEYHRIGEEQMAVERFNAHNQFLEVLIENGIIGLALFVSIFITMFYIGFTEKNLLYILFILMIIMFFQFETVLYRLAGVSFFALFSFLLPHIKSSPGIGKTS